MKNLFTKLFALTLVASTALFIGTACKEEEPPHEHTYSETWTTDYDYHYKKATCEHTNAYVNKGNHTYENGACTVCGYAQEGVGLVFNLNTDGQSYSVGKDYAYTQENVVIPSTYKGKPVTNVGGFGGRKDLITISIPDSVKTIEANAFYECTNLTTVTLPSGLESMGRTAFGQCTSLTEIVIPNSVTSIDQAAFIGCSKLKSVTLGNGLKEIKNLFSSCTSLTEIVFPNALETIGENTFYNCASLTTVVIPNSVKSIGKYAFQNCTNLYSVTIGESVEDIDTWAFRDCYKLIEVINKSNKITVQSGKYFHTQASDGLEPESYLGKYALKVFNSGDTYVNIFTVDDNGFVTYQGTKGKILVNYIGTQSEIIIPSDVVDIRPYALYKIAVITSITFEDTSTWYATNNSSDWSNKNNGTEIDVTNTATNVTNFADTYKDYYWYKK